MEINENSKFAVFGEVEGYEKQLIILDLSFGRLVDEVLIPYEEDKPFFIDGVSITKKKIRRLKILIEGKSFENSLSAFHTAMRWGPLELQKIYAEQYHIRFEAIVRETCEDITSQVIKAYNKEIKPKLKDYIPKREELISAGLRVLIESIRILGKSALT